MENYNPRQNTRMRWKDAKELEKFKFINGEFSFTNKVLEQASKHKTWSKIVEVIENGSAYKPVLIFDITNNEFYFGSQENDSLYLQNLYGNQGYELEINYDIITDKLTITSTENNYLTAADAPKMYRHEIELRADNTVYSFRLISSNNSKVTSLQDLTTILKPSGSIWIAGICELNSSDKVQYLVHNYGAWKIGLYPSPLQNVTEVVIDTVEEA